MSLRSLARDLSQRRHDSVSALCLQPLDAQTQSSLIQCRVPIDATQTAVSPARGRHKTHRKSFFSGCRDHINRR